MHASQWNGLSVRAFRSGEILDGSDGDWVWRSICSLARSSCLGEREKLEDFLKKLTHYWNYVDSRAGRRRSICWYQLVDRQRIHRWKKRYTHLDFASKTMIYILHSWKCTTSNHRLILIVHWRLSPQTVLLSSRKTHPLVASTLSSESLTTRPTWWVTRHQLSVTSGGRSELTLISGDTFSTPPPPPTHPHTQIQMHNAIFEQSFAQSPNSRDAQQVGSI